jgi:hypothetical protein
MSAIDTSTNSYTQAPQGWKACRPTNATTAKTLYVNTGVQTIFALRDISRMQNTSM